MKPYLTRRHSIIISALEIVEELGIDGLSIRELAKRQDVVEGALYRHFKSKEEILLAVVEYHARYDSKIINTITNSTTTSKEKVLFYIRSFAELFESEPAMTCVLSSYEVLLEDNPVVNRVKDIFNSRSEYLTYLIEEGQKEGSIDSDFSGEDLADAVMGLLRIITLKWRMSKYKFSLKIPV